MSYNIITINNSFSIQTWKNESVANPAHLIMFNMKQNYLQYRKRIDLNKTPSNQNMINQKPYQTSLALIYKWGYAINLHVYLQNT